MTIRIQPTQPERRIGIKVVIMLEKLIAELCCTVNGDSPEEESQ